MRSSKDAPHPNRLLVSCVAQFASTSFIFCSGRYKSLMFCRLRINVPSRRKVGCLLMVTSRWQNPKAARTWSFTFPLPRSGGGKVPALCFRHFVLHIGTNKNSSVTCGFDLRSGINRDLLVLLQMGMACRQGREWGRREEEQKVQFRLWEGVPLAYTFTKTSKCKWLTCDTWDFL